VHGAHALPSVQKQIRRKRKKKVAEESFWKKFFFNLDKH
jgi:hypothetical protein